MGARGGLVGPRALSHVAPMFVPPATTLPMSSRLPPAEETPSKAVSLAFSDVKRPVVNTVKANTAATTTKAMRTIAVSRPVIPF